MERVITAKITTLISAKTDTGAGTVESNGMARSKTIQTFAATSSGAGALTMLVQATNIDPPGANDWFTIATLTLALTTTRATDGLVVDAPWRWIRGNVSAISGTGAAASLLIGHE